MRPATALCRSYRKGLPRPSLPWCSSGCWRGHTSDGWETYAGVSHIAGGIYLHDVVIHENFARRVHPDIHTQNVECMWMRAKAQVAGWHFTGPLHHLPARVHVAAASCEDEREHRQRRGRGQPPRQVYCLGGIS